jgi:hypothetical protein
MSATSYLRHHLMDHLFGVVTFTPPANRYLSLHSANPGEAGSHAFEITTVSSGYSRLDLNGLMTAPDPTTGLTVNNTTLIIGPALIPWTVNFLGLEDASSGGNMLMPGIPTVPKLIAVGTPFMIPPGQLQIRFT